MGLRNQPLPARAAAIATVAAIATAAAVTAIATAATAAITTATAAATTAAAAAAATTTTATAAFTAFVRGVHPERTAVEHLAIHRVSRRACFVLGRILDEPETARATRFTIDHDGCGRHLPMGGERVLELLVHGAVRQIANVETSAHGPSSFSAPVFSPSNGRSVLGNRFNDSPPRCGRDRRQHTTRRDISRTDDRHSPFITFEKPRKPRPAPAMRMTQPRECAFASHHPC